jgi:hypothetical protein
LVVRRDRAGEAVITTISKLAIEDLLLQRGDIHSMKKRRIREHLRDYGAPRRGVACKLDLNHRHAPRRLDRQQVCVPATERDFPTNDHQLRCPRQREELRSFLDQAVQRRLVSEAGSREQAPTRTVVTP